MSRMSKVRCAIYTRKSSEEGLEQDFNSLDAQYEACAAYVASQASEGWSLLKQRYDDGGLSGGTMERPGLQALLEDVRAGRIDIVVVYKVDRLTRSLLDFARLVETFDAAEASFVSVTQSFNTTTSMGRLTLNMLLSFAQFEREVTAERIRDKIAASKAKGMWMGGTPPLGYKANGRSLRIVPGHAELVRRIFASYLDCGTVRALKERLDDEGLLAPERSTATGRTYGGGRFARGQLYKLLSNPIYLGEICHKGQVHEGLHKAIVDRETWDAVQAQLSKNKQGVEERGHAAAPSLLAGRVVDEDERPLRSDHACKGKVRYRYYVGEQTTKGTGNGTAALRMPALELEKLVCNGVAEALNDPLNLLEQLGVEATPATLDRCIRTKDDVVTRLRKCERTLVREILERVAISQHTIEVTLRSTELAATLGLDRREGGGPVFAIELPAALHRCGRAVRLVDQEGHSVTRSEAPATLMTLLRKAYRWWSEMIDERLTVTELGKRHGVTSSYVSRVVRLNFLSPRIVEAILDCSQSAKLDAKRLLGLNDLSLDWRRQERELGFSS